MNEFLLDIIDRLSPQKKQSRQAAVAYISVKRRAVPVSEKRTVGDNSRYPPMSSSRLLIAACAADQEKVSWKRKRVFHRLR
ncbi:hypothetical protein [Acetobacter senegalensis]|jgi:hypothetical protein|uniref:hypothetical protein n=1 Tax=Acetobacter senegalensis TaxID=446692 RepID=UPI001EDB96D8|nr:hypothetical protein [Acetobacter senegalensis]